jgi:hypothetical protein
MRMLPEVTTMTRSRIFDSFAWILLGLLLGACVGALITFAHQAASLEAFGILKGMAVGAVLGSLGGMVVVSTKAAFHPAVKPMGGVIFPSQEHDDAWYYRCAEGGLHGPFNRSMMRALIEAGAAVLEEISHPGVEARYEETEICLPAFAEETELSMRTVG